LKRIVTAAVLAAAAWGVAGAAQADPPEGFDARVEQIRAAVGVPGIAVAIVEHGRVTLARGYGVRQLGESAPVDADTIFPLGSVGKAFTTAALAVLVTAAGSPGTTRSPRTFPGSRCTTPGSRAR
jgi:CubicO group peptidase (beta-lactamase class C family)